MDAVRNKANPTHPVNIKTMPSPAKNNQMDEKSEEHPSRPNHMGKHEILGTKNTAYLIV